MLITAKYPSTCPQCSQPITAGSMVNWTKGSKACHVTCPTVPGSSKRPAAVPKSATPPSVEAAPYVRGEKWAPCKREALPNTTGEVRVAGATKRPWASLREGAVGELALEGEAFVVVAQTAYYESAEANEDMGDMTGPGWQVSLYLRRATPEEAAPALAIAAAAQAKRAAIVQRGILVRELVALCRMGWCQGDTSWRPSGRQVILAQGSHTEVAYLSDDGDAVAVWDSGWSDDYREMVAVSREPRAIEIMKTLLAEVAS